MKVIDLLNKIAKKKEIPEKIIYKNKIWNFDKDIEDYYYYEDNFRYWLLCELNNLNDEIEIAKDTPKKIENLIINHYKNPVEQLLYNKINQIINYINEGKNE